MDTKEIYHPQSDVYSANTFPDLLSGKIYNKYGEKVKPYMGMIVFVNFNEFKLFLLKDSDISKPQNWEPIGRCIEVDKSLSDEDPEFQQAVAEAVHECLYGTNESPDTPITEEEQLMYIMDVKTLEISKVKIDEVDECKFALYVFNERKCHFNLRGATIQTLESSGGHCARYLVSKDSWSLQWIKESFQWLVGDIGFILHDAWKKIYDEKFDSYKKRK